MGRSRKYAVLVLGLILGTASWAQEEGPAAGREWMRPTGMLLSGETAIPMSGGTKEFRRLLGKGHLTGAEANTGCGDWFNESALRYLTYPFLRLELGPGGAAMWMAVYPTEADIALLTSKGKLDEHTTLEEVQGWFVDPDALTYEDPDEGTVTLTVPEGAELDSAVRLVFTTEGKLIIIEHFIPC